MSFATWSQTAASNTSVGGLTLDGNVQTVSNLDNIVRGMMAEEAVARDDGTIIAVYPRGYLFGLTLSNNAGDATNDIDIAVGECVTSDSPYWRMALASILTKRLDANWVVGTNQGGLDTGAIADTTYHIWLIARSDTGVVDALFSAQPSNPTMPANYDRKRRIGSIVRTGAAIKPFVQDGDLFTWVTPINNVTAANPGTSAVTRSLTLPGGIRVRAKLSAAYLATAAGDIPGAIYLSDLSTADIVPSNSNGVSFNSFGTAAGSYSGGSQVEVMTNTSAQIRSRCQLSTAGTTLFITTYGWFDNRGRV